MKLYINYMVSLRCKLLVKEEIEKLGHKLLSVELGVIELVEAISDEKREDFRRRLLKVGLELLDSKKGILIEKIKTIVIEMIHYSDELLKINFSDYLSKELDLDYNYMANIFSEVKGITIEHYIISNKIERVKELLLYDELSLTEISFQMNYSSVAHLSNQFKKVTGLTPTFFKQLSQNKRRIALEEL